MAEDEQGLDETLSRSRGSCTPAGEDTHRRKLPTRQSLRGKREKGMRSEDPKLAGVLHPVVSLERLAVNHANLKREKDLSAPLKLLGNASNREIADTLGVRCGQLDKMSVSQLLVRLRKDEASTATRQKVTKYFF